ncbi:FtsW/RodA/SpoVE family cell cycle protein [Spongisporangium articulatum]|uniref:FtsW/RodA/SpoVE family cell cycle protein n=1 Tax=Spongisporangium articulatum TaxID=3362603 RepID=A0ABW8AI65_9ACTN
MAVVTAVATPRTGRNLEAALTAVAIGVAVFAYGLAGVAQNDGSWPPGMLGYGLAFGAFTGLLHVVLRWRAPYADPTLLPIATLINGLGLVMIHRLDLSEGRSTGGSLAVRQMVWTAVGILAATLIVMLLNDHRVLSRFTYIAMVSGLVLLLMPLVPGIGKNINGARIWIGLGPFSFQPGELAKIVLTVFFAGYLVTARDSLSLVGRKILGLQLPRGRDLGPILAAWVVSVGILVLIENDLGTGLLFFGVFVALIYVATERLSWVLIGLVLFAGGALVAAVSIPHVQTRVSIWLHPFAADNLDRSYQLVQGLFGMASGGLLGTGLGQGRPEIVPYAESDFIYSALGEELGLAGLFAILLLYVLIVERGLRTAIGVRDGFGKLLAAGLSFSMALQVFVVVGGVTRVIPLTGLTTPFLAYGGSSLLSNWMIIALLMRISDSARRPAGEGAVPPILPPSSPPAPTGQMPTPAGASGGSGGGAG